MNKVLVETLSNQTILSLQVICSFLFAVSVLFIFIELRTKFDRSFLYFGLSLAGLCAMVAIDIWVSPNSHVSRNLLSWIRTQHMMGCIFILFLVQYLMILTKTVNPKFVRMTVFLTLVESASLFSDLTLRAVPGGGVEPGPLYNFFFAPYFLFYVIAANYLIIRNLWRPRGADKRILWFHFAGIVILGVAGSWDLIRNMNPSAAYFYSATTFGALGYGVMASVIFAERFLMLLKDRETTFAKLESAYRDLEQVNALKQIGESTAIINHEIKNYMFMISGNAQILEEMEHLSQKGKDIVRNIVTSVERLTLFSDDILKMSRIQVTREKHPINLTELVKGVVDKHYPTRRDSIVLQGMERDHFLFGDWGKLEQAFVNVFNNSFEAGQGSPVEIKVRVTDGPSLLLVSVEDNGVGCDKEQLGNLFKAFYTTKKYQGGTGLGMSITRTIVESHGGKVSAYSKNLARKEDHGLKLIMSFPIYAQSLAEEAQRKHPIVLIKDGMDNLTDIIRVFQNVKVTPRIIQGAEELNEADFPPDAMTVLVSAKTMASQFTRLSQFPKLCLVSHHERNLYVLDYGRGNRPEVFSEEYVISRLIQKVPPRTRLRERQVHTLTA